MALKATIAIVLDQFKQKVNTTMQNVSAYKAPAVSLSIYNWIFTVLSQIYAKEGRSLHAACHQKLQQTKESILC